MPDSRWWSKVAPDIPLKLPAELRVTATEVVDLGKTADAGKDVTISADLARRLSLQLIALRDLVREAEMRVDGEPYAGGACVFCGEVDRGTHALDCPWPKLLAIVR